MFVINGHQNVNINVKLLALGHFIIIMSRWILAVVCKNKNVLVASIMLPINDVIISICGNNLSEA